MGVCAPYPGKPYSSVEGRKLFAGKRRRRPCEFAPTLRKALFFRRGAQTFCREEPSAGVGFAPHSLESLISPLRGANLLPGRGASGRVSLRLTPGKALFFRQEAQTFCREKPRRLCEFAPYTQESLILPLRGANLLPGRATGGGVGLRLTPGKALFHR